MKIKNIKGLSAEQINYELKNGAKFVVFQYCVSFLIVTIKKGSGIYFIKSGESTIKYSLTFSLISLLFGWWGLPWGPVHTIVSVYQNILGGKNVTDEVLEAFNVEKKFK